MREQVADWLDAKGCDSAAQIVRLYGLQDMPVRTVDWMDVRSYLCCLMPPLESRDDRDEIGSVILAINLKGAGF